MATGIRIDRGQDRKIRAQQLHDSADLRTPLRASDSDALLDDAGVAGLSGTAFGAFGEGYLRFSVANSVENLQNALDRIDQWTKKNL